MFALLISGYNLLNQWVSYNIFFRKADKFDGFYMRQDVLDVYKSGLNALRQVYLCYITRNHGLGVVAQAGEKHLHLVDGGILSLVENDKCVVQSASSHKCKWRNFECVHFHEVLQLRIG